MVVQLDPMETKFIVQDYKSKFMARLLLLRSGCTLQLQTMLLLVACSKWD